MWKLTHGQVHVTDVSNAARTMLFNVHTNQWDDELLALLRIPKALLPEVLPSARTLATRQPTCWAIPSASVAWRATSKAHSFGQTCFTAGMAKNYGTGLLHADAYGQHLPDIAKRLAHHQRSAGFQQPEFAMEGSVFVGGAVVQWLRDGLRAITNSSGWSPSPKACRFGRRDDGARLHRPGRAPGSPTHAAPSPA